MENFHTIWKKVCKTQTLCLNIINITILLGRKTIFSHVEFQIYLNITPFSEILIKIK